VQFLIDISNLREERTGETNHVPDRGLGKGILYIDYYPTIQYNNIATP
jgi:hypothetical protein